MTRTHVLDGAGLDAAVRHIQRQTVLWYDSPADRDADLKKPWDGATVLYPVGGVLRLESWYGGAWRILFPPASSSGTPGVTDHGGLTGLADDDHPQYLTAAEADLAYVNVSGDTMTNMLRTPRVDVLDPAVGAGQWATQRFYHDNNVDFLAVDVQPSAQPGYQVSDSRDAGGVLLRVARGERVSFPLKGHAHRWQASARVASTVYGAGGFVKVALTAVDDPAGLVGATNTGISIPEAGYYAAWSSILTSVAMATCDALMRFTVGPVDPVTFKWSSAAAIQTFGFGFPAYYFPAAGRLELWFGPSIACTAGGTAASIFNVVSLF